MKILVDESLPRYLKMLLTSHDVSTVQEMGWAGIKNGPLLKLAEPLFDIFLTADKNLRYQHNLKGRKLSILVMPSNKLSVIKNLEIQLKTSIAQIRAGEYLEL